MGCRPKHRRESHNLACARHNERSIPPAPPWQPVFPNTHIDIVADDRGFRRHSLCCALCKDQQPLLGACVLDRSAHERVDQLLQHYLTHQSPGPQRGTGSDCRRNGDFVHLP